MKIKKTVKDIASELRSDLFHSTNHGTTLNLIEFALNEAKDIGEETMLSAFNFLFEPINCECTNCYSAWRMIRNHKKELLKVDNKRRSQKELENGAVVMMDSIPDIAQSIVDHFFQNGAVISKKDYDFIKEKLSKVKKA